MHPGHPVFRDIVFDADTHTYALDGQPLTAVSRILERVKPPFNRQSQAEKTAARTGQTVAEVLQEWDAKRLAGLARGTRIHEYIRGRLLNQGRAPTSPLVAFSTDLPEMGAFDAYWPTVTSRDTSLRVAYVEWIIGDAGLGIAGTVDLLVHSDVTGKYHIVDWKSGKFESKPWGCLLAPLDDLPNSDFIRACLQTGLYRLIVERHTGWELGDSYIVHLRGDGQFHTHVALDYRDVLLAWLLPTPPAGPAIVDLSDDALEVVA